MFFKFVATLELHILGFSKKCPKLGDSRSWESPEKVDNVWRLFIQILLR